jgi:hypothetical protein
MLNRNYAVTNIVLGTSPNRDVKLEPEDEELEDLDHDGDSIESDHEPSDEIHMLLEVMSECISSLLRIGILVRKAVPRDRFKQAMQAAECAFPDKFDIDYVRNKFPKVRADWLLSRLGSSITKRRQFIKYCRDHRTRLGAMDLPTADARVEVFGTATERQSSKATTFVPRPELLNPLQVGLLEQEDEDDAVSFMSASSTTEALSVLKLPRLADLSQGQQPFECPICFTLQSFQREKQWRYVISPTTHFLKN